MNLKLSKVCFHDKRSFNDNHFQFFNGIIKNAFVFFKLHTSHVAQSIASPTTFISKGILQVKFQVHTTSTRGDTTVHIL